MLNQRKYIISAFLILAFAFIGFYFVTGFILKRPRECGVDDNMTYATSDTDKLNNDGKIIFQNKCAACHILHKNFTGPDLIAFTERGPWTDKKKVLEYLRNPDKFYKENRSSYIENLYKYSEIKHLVFSITETEVDAIIRYLSAWRKPIP